MYLAGYGVECVLKALILSVTSTGATPETLASFRGAKAHDYEWLRFRYRSLGGPDFPPEAAKNFVRVNAWSTSLRYKTGTTKRRDAEDFLKASRAILQWADGRL